jgi:hypothetical protein
MLRQESAGSQSCGEESHSQACLLRHECRGRNGKAGRKAGAGVQECISKRDQADKCQAETKTQAGEQE